VSSRSLAHAGGVYTLGLQVGLPVGKPVTLGQAVPGGLLIDAPEGCFGFNNLPVDRWQFAIPTTTTLTIDVSSTAFDTFVCLLDSNNNRLAWDYDSGPGTNSRLISQNLPLGTYYIEVASSSAGQAGGAYTLSLQPGL